MIGQTQTLMMYAYTGINRYGVIKKKGNRDKNIRWLGFQGGMETDEYGNGKRGITLVVKLSASQRFMLHTH